MADQLIRRRRGTLQEEEREKAVEDKPNMPVIVVFMDESGKSQDNLIVGSVWILLNMREIHLTLYHIQEDQLGGKEFHFKNIRENSVHSYYEMVDIFPKYANTANFKALYVPRTGLRRREVEVIPDLYYHLLVEGIEYEFSTGRAKPPRKLFVFIDSSESQMDAVMCENLEDRLHQVSHSVYDGKLIDVKVQTLDSKSTIFLQIADLVASSINRLLSSSGENTTEKDEFARYFLSKVGIDINNLKEDQIGDTSVLISI